jgi:hypothetical protein
MEVLFFSFDPYSSNTLTACSLQASGNNEPTRMSQWLAFVCGLKPVEVEKGYKMSYCVLKWR